ncbi:hypothetical protein NPIL_203181, partial [Nephila pilipes]
MKKAGTVNLAVYKSDEARISLYLNDETRCVQA